MPIIMLKTLVEEEESVTYKIDDKHASILNILSSAIQFLRCLISAVLKLSSLDVLKTINQQIKKSKMYAAEI